MYFYWTPFCRKGKEIPSLNLEGSAEMDDDVDEASGINRKAKVQFKIIRQSQINCKLQVYYMSTKTKFNLI